MGERGHILDTTLRDGEQSCGCSMTVAEKLRMAGKLEDLGVDVIEAGFPIASEGDAEAVRRIAGEHRDVSIAALARCDRRDIEAAERALRRARRPRIHLFIATSPIRGAPSPSPTAPKKTTPTPAHRRQAAPPRALGHALRARRRPHRAGCERGCAVLRCGRLDRPSRPLRCSPPRRG
jgi:hypothetical protein